MWGGAYGDHYFGHLDCHRVACSNSLKTIPQLMMSQEEGVAGDCSGQGGLTGVRVCHLAHKGVCRCSQQ